MTDLTMMLMRGIPASGKSTQARAWVAEHPDWRFRVNRDDLRMMGYNAFVLSHMKEDSVTVAQMAQVEALLNAGISVVIDDTNLRASVVKDWLRVAHKTGANVEYTDVNTPLDQCIKNNAARAAEGGANVPEDVIRSFHSRYITKGRMPEFPEIYNERPAWVPYERPEFGTPAILVDIDGTLARMSDRSPYDWARVGEDELIHQVADVVKTIYNSGTEVIFMSGRDSACRSQTAQWLLDNGFVVDHLYMRAENDNRKDSEVKHELFNKHVRENFNVVGVFDDRKQVCEMWEAIGLTLFRVGPMNSDF